MCSNPLFSHVNHMKCIKRYFAYTLVSVHNTSCSHTTTTPTTDENYSVDKLTFGRIFKERRYQDVLDSFIHLITFRDKEKLKLGSKIMFKMKQLRLLDCNVYQPLVAFRLLKWFLEIFQSTTDYLLTCLVEVSNSQNFAAFGWWKKCLGEAETWRERL